MTIAPPTIERVAPTRHGRLVRRQVVVFVVLAYGLSWWPLLGRLANPEAAPVIPIGPSIAALLVVGWVYGRTGVRALLRSATDPHIGRWWWTAAIPFAVSVAGALLAVLAGATRPTGADVAMAGVALTTLPLMLLVNGPLGEELGWRGYLLPRLLRRHAPITATLLLLPLWIGFHLPLIVTAPDRFGIWWALAVAGMAFTMTWLHLRTGGSVLLAIVFHAVANTSAPAAIQLFAEADRPLAWRLTAALWLTIGVVVAAGPLRRGAPQTTQPSPGTDREIPTEQQR
jgi:membrane protease YdiL (CAAX protease family)